MTIDGNQATLRSKDDDEDSEIRLARLRALRVIEMERQAHRDRKRQLMTSRSVQLADKLDDDGVAASDSASQVAPQYTGYRTTNLVEESGEIVEESESVLFELFVPFNYPKANTT